MSKKETGGSAFPRFEFHIGYQQMMPVGGMTLRDYFAAHAMNTVCDELGRFNQYEEVAKGAYKMADAMMKARDD